jgi:hypothetical protein
MSQFTLGAGAYLVFRLAPAIVVGCLALNSFLNQDAKALAYLFGLALACAAAVGARGLIPAPKPGSPPLAQPGPICGTLSLGAGGAPLSLLPLSLVTYSFTLFYIVYYILFPTAARRPAKNADFTKHWAIITLLVVLMALDVAWHVANGCIRHPSPLAMSSAAIVLGGLVGFAWGATVGSIRGADRYMNKKGTVSCWSPSSLIYMCRDKTVIGSIL